jgi:hypothetical protein
MRMWTGFIWLSIGTSGRLCENCNKPLGSIKGRECLSASQERLCCLELVKVHKNNKMEATFCLKLG